MTTQFLTTQAARAALLETVATALKVKGFTIEQTVTNRLHVSEATVGRVATLTADRVRYFNDVACDAHIVKGELDYEPRFGARDTRYALTAGMPNLGNIVARLRRDVREIAEQIAQQRERQRRQQADDAVLVALPTVEGVQVSVYDGKVDIRFTDITEEQARAVLAAFAAFTAI
jgi:hypothetical protein